MTTTSPSDSPIAMLRSELSGCAFDPYLLTVTAGQTVHCGVVSPEWDEADGRVHLQAPSSWPGSEQAGLQTVTLLWPPNQPGGYSLIADGTAESVAEPDQRRLAVTITRAVWHRPGVAPDGSGPCGSDCKPIFSSKS